MSTNPLPEHRFRPNLAVAAYLSLYFLFVISGATAIAVLTDRYGLLDILLQIVVSVALIGCPAFCVWRLSGSRRAGNITCVVMTTLLFGCVGFGYFAAYQSGSQQVEHLDHQVENKEEGERQAAVERYERTCDELEPQSQLDQALRGEDVNDAALARLNKFADASEELGQTGHPKDRINGVIAVYTRQLRDALVPYNQAVLTYVDSGMTDTSTMKSQQDIRDRIDLLDICIAYCAGMRQQYQSSKEEFRNGLRELDMTEIQVDRVMAAWFRNSMPDERIQLHDLELKTYESDREVLVFLHDQWGNWRGDGHGYAFFSALMLDETYRRLLRRVDQAVEDFEIAHQELGDKIKHAQQQLP